MKLSKNQLLVIRSKYYERYGGEKYFPANEENRHYEELASELLAFTQRVKNDCFSICTKNCLAAEGCKIEKVKTAKTALTASKKQLSQLLHNPSPKAEIQHDRFNEGFIELCCRFVNINWNEFKNQFEAPVSTIFVSQDFVEHENKIEPAIDLNCESEEKQRTDTEYGNKGSQEKFDHPKTNYWKWSTLLCTFFIICLLCFVSNKKMPISKKNHPAINRDITDTTFIQAYKNFHNATVAKNWNLAWGLTTEKWRNSDERQIRERNDFAKYYRMTKEFTLKKWFFIESSSDSLVAFYAWYEYKDDTPKLPNRDILLSSQIEKLASKELTSNFIDEIYSTIQKTHIVPVNINRNNIDSICRSYSIEKLVLRDNIVELIAINLNLFPNPNNKELFDKNNTAPINVMMKVEMKREIDTWKINQTTTIMTTPK